MGEKDGLDGPKMEFDAPLTTCPLCDSTRIHFYIADFKEIRIYRCDSCTVLFVNPQYTASALAEFYSHYTESDPAKIQAGYDPVRRERKRRNLLELRRGLGSDPRFLGIGCGDGLELVIARELGFKVEGYDVDSRSASAVQAATGVPVASGDLFSAGFGAGSYDCVFLEQVLEHPKNPAAHLRLVHDLLRPGGLCYLGVPNITSLSNRWKSFRDRVGLRSRERVGSHFDTWHHLHYYSPRCFRTVLEPRFGLRVDHFHADPEPTMASPVYSLRRALPLLDSSLIVIAHRT